uniref:Uncharacterized protein n=1 Tax=Oryza sativa subsp. indica TaxID=39946 RepID=A0A679BBA6_ORYSI|nr:hypothetical protein [Oryza sativa Indica Group]
MRLKFISSGSAQCELRAASGYANQSVGSANRRLAVNELVAVRHGVNQGPLAELIDPSAGGSAYQYVNGVNHDPLAARIGPAAV